MSNNKLEGKVAIITGGASGIGKTTAYLFSEHGAHVVIADIQDEVGGQEVAASIDSQKCSYFHCDVADEEQVKAMVEWTVQKHGQVDIMFSNAGIIRATKGTSNFTQSILDLDFVAFDHLFSVNFRGMASCVKHAARAMVERGVRGSIICTASVCASSAGDHDTDYFMSKHAVLGLVRSASKQMGQHGIRVNNISPSVVATPLMCNLTGKEAEETEKFFEGLTKLKGVVVKEKHVADAVLFLASVVAPLFLLYDLICICFFLLLKWF